MKLFKITCLIIITTFMFSCSKKTNEVAATKNPTPAAESRESAMNDGEERAERRGGERRGEGRGGNPEARQKRMEKMYADLNLSEAQITKANEINDKYRARMEAMRGTSGGDRETRRATMMELRNQQNEEYKNIMTAEQYAQYLKIIESQKGRRGGRRGGGGK